MYSRVIGFFIYFIIYNKPTPNLLGSYIYLELTEIKQRSENGLWIALLINL